MILHTLPRERGAGNGYDHPQVLADAELRQLVKLQTHFADPRAMAREAVRRG